MAYTRHFVSLLSVLYIVHGSRISISEDGGYNDIVFKIHKEISETDCPAILKGIKDLMDLSSSSLSTALSGSAYFKSLTVVVPAAWRDSSCGVSIRAPSPSTPYASADVVVNKPGALSGYFPYAHQSGGCGSSGQYISLPYTFITDRNVTQYSAKRFVHEWSKFRYGIFDDSGFSGDRLYPAFYKEEGRTLPVVAHNGDLSGAWLKEGEPCSPDGTEHCSFTPDVNEEITCSLGHRLPNLHNTTRYCSSLETKAVPSKQSVLCGGRSAMDVIAAHPDFAGVSVVNEDRDLTPEIRIVREPTTKYVLAIDTSSSMRDHWRWIHKAAHKFIRYDLPVNSNLAIVTFNSAAKVEHHLVQVLSDATRALLADTVPVKYHLSAADRSCVECALDTVFSQLLGDTNVAGAHIIVVSSNDSPLTPSAAARMEAVVAANNAKVSSIVIPSRDAAAAQPDFYDSLAALSGGSSVQISDSGHSMDLLLQLNEAFAAILAADSIHPTEVPQVVHRAEYYSGDEAVSEGRFVVDSSLGRDTLFGLYVKDEEDHLIRSVQFTDSAGNVYGPFTKMSSTFDLVNLKTINYVGQMPPFGDPGQLGREWRYLISWFPTSSTTRKSIVTVTSKPRLRDEHQLISVKTWTNHAEKKMEEEEEAPVRIFAEVTKGGRGVLNCSVLLDVEVETDNGTTLAILPIQLNDNGNGDVDLMSGDGIYSGVLTSYPARGRYTFTVRVSASDHSLVPDLGVVAQAVSGGSAVHHKRLIPTGEFVRTVRGPVLNIQHLPSVLPPGKITDFKVVVAGEGRLTTSWTSSGGDYSSGWVAGYRFIYSARISDLLAPNGEPSALLSLDKHQAAGVQTSQEVYFPHYDTDFYMAVVAVDEEGNRGPPSNLVHVYVPGPVVEPVVDSVTESGPAFNLLSSEKDWIMVGVICGILLVLIVISVVSISYFCCMSTRRSGGKVARKVSTSASISDVHVASSGSSDHTDGTDAGSFDSDMKNLSAGHIAPYDAEYGGYNPRHVEVETPTKENSTRTTPVYWSASQLLSKLEEEGSYSPHPDYYYAAAANASRLEVVPDYTDQQHPGPRPNIPEEFCVTVSNLTSKYNNRENIHLSSDAAAGRSSNAHRHSHRGGARAEKMPPPLYPKPKNITQV